MGYQQTTLVGKEIKIIRKQYLFIYTILLSIYSMTFVVSVDFQIAADSPLSHHLKTPAMAAYTWNLQFQRQHFFQKRTYSVKKRILLRRKFDMASRKV